MARPTGEFRHTDRLRRPAEFQRVSREGRRVAEPAFLLLVAPSAEAGSGAQQRLGITVSRRVGGAVARNRVKRRVREWFRRARCGLRPGIDLVVIGRSAAASLSGRDTEGILCRMAHEAGAKRG
jgi:ribonuclease P protein component